MFTGLALWKQHVNLLLQSFRSVRSDLSANNNIQQQQFVNYPTVEVTNG